METRLHKHSLTPKREIIELNNLMHIDWSKSIEFENPISRKHINSFSCAMNLAKHMFSVTGNKIDESDLKIIIAENIVAAVIYYIVTHRTSRSRNLAFVVTLSCNMDLNKAVKLLQEFPETSSYVEYINQDEKLYAETTNIIENLIGKLFTKEYIFLFIFSGYTPDFYKEEDLLEGFREIPKVVNSWF